ncbi:hypothetical protein F5879DRAFT_990093 [Lentinula edodes]|nr:hypothetical protein F5879DRAFT_990093 [Lentinula edodes]
MGTPTQITEGLSLFSSSNELSFARRYMHDLDQNLRHIPIYFQKLTELRLQCEALFRGNGFRKLPLELMSEIFVHCLEPVSCPDGGESCRPHTQSSGIAFVLSQVCRQWRTVALSTPALWTFLNVVVPYTNDVGTVYPNFINCCLERSRILPLHIVLSAFDQDDEETDGEDTFQIISRTINRLIPECSRWESFELMIDSDPWLDVPTPSFRPIPPTGTPTLRSIYIHIRSEHFSWIVAWISELMSSSPNLQEICLTSAEGIQFADISWDHLQIFKILEEIQMKDLFLLFMNCSGLQICEAYLDTPVHLVIVSSPEIVMDHLHTLILTCAKETDLKAVFCWLTLPALKVLALSGFCNAEWPAESFSNFLSRSEFSLETLSLTKLAFTDAQLVSYLYHSSIHDSLETLVIEPQGEIISSFLLDFLTFKLPSSDMNTMHAPVPLLPKLNSILFTVNAITQTVALRHFVASRWYDTATYEVPLPVACLKHIYVRLAVPYAPNVKFSIDDIKHVFSRVCRSRGTALKLETVFTIFRLMGT